MLYADGLVIIVESLVELEERYLTWKNNIESKGLKVNIGKIKIRKCRTNDGLVFASGKHFCCVCKKGVGSFYKHWVHKRCSGFKGRLIDIPDFKCHTCLHPPESEKKVHKFKLDNFDYKRMDKFSYLGDTLSASGGAEASSITQIRTDWKKFP